jgi:hypothetical protein
MPDFTYKIESITGSPTLVYWVTPMSQHDIETSTEMEDDSFIYRGKMKGNIIIADDIKAGTSYYTDVLKVIESTRPDDVFKFTIFNNTTVVFYGLFTSYDVEYDDNWLRGTIKIEPYDQYQEIFDVWENEVNILGATKTKVMSNYYSRLGIFFSDTASAPADEYWKAYHTETMAAWSILPAIYLYAREYVKTDKYINLFADGFNITNMSSVDGYSIFARYYDDIPNYTAPATADIRVLILNDQDYIMGRDDTKSDVWNIDLSPIAGWNVVPADESSIISIDPESGDYYKVRIYIKDTHYDFEKFNIKTIIHRQGVHLKTAIDYMFDQWGLDFTCKSTFLFNDAVPSVCPLWIQQVLNERSYYNYITQDTSQINNLYLIEKTDYKNPYASEAATTNNIKLSELMDDLKYMFFEDLDWYIDPEGYFRIEHVIFFNSGLGMDLRSTRTINQTEEDEGFNYFTGFTPNIRDKYKYETGKTPQKEIYKPYEAGYSDFTTLTIKYSNVPVVGKKENKVEKQLSFLITDAAYVTEQVEKVSNDGTMIVACDETSGKMYISEDIGAFSGEELKNARLSMANIFTTYGKYYRYRLTGTVNDIVYTFLTIRPNKEMDEFEFVTAEPIDEGKRIATDYGYGIIKNVTRKISTGNNKVTLMFDNQTYTDLYHGVH